MVFLKPELSFEIVYSSQHLIEVEITASNGSYSGRTSFYINPDGEELREFAGILKGFPKEIGQTTAVEFGLPKSKNNAPKDEKAGLAKVYSYASFHFYCFDKSGHTAVYIDLLEEHWKSVREDSRARAMFELRFDPASLDQFILELDQIALDKEGRATLAGIHSY